MASNGNWRRESPTNQPGSVPEMDQLKQAFDALKAEEPGTPFADLRRRVALASGPAQGKGLATMWNKEFWNGARIALVACLLLLVVACTVPVSYEQDTGAQVELLVAGELDEVIDFIHAQDWEVRNLDIKSRPEGHQLKLEIDGSTDASLEALGNLPQVTDLNMRPWVHEVEGTLFSMVMNRVFQIELDISGMDDDEINRALQEQLDASGFPGEVTIQRQDGFPSVMVDVSMEEGAEPTELRIELQDEVAGIETEDVWVQDGNGPEIELGDLEGLSEEEIHARVLAQLAAQGVNMDSVQVFVQQDGQSGEGVEQQELRLEIIHGEGSAAETDGAGGRQVNKVLSRD